MRSNTSMHAPQDKPVLCIEPPQVPFGFEVRAAPAPLISAADGRWIVRAADEESGNEGILVYEDSRAIVFMTADEVAMYLAYLIREGWNLIPEIDLALSEAHAQAGEQMRSLWWLEETRKSRALVNRCLLDQQEEVQV